MLPITYKSVTLADAIIRLVDDDMVDWLRTDGLTSATDLLAQRDMPDRLRHEVLDWAKGYGKGTLMLQAECFRNLAWANEHAPRLLSCPDLEKMQRKFEDMYTQKDVCYCQTHHMCSSSCRETEYGSGGGSVKPCKDEFGVSTDTVVCAFAHCKRKFFHRGCVRKLGVDKVSKWYCLECDRRIGDVAQDVLEDVECLRRGEEVTAKKIGKERGEDWSEPEAKKKAYNMIGKVLESWVDEKVKIMEEGQGRRLMETDLY